MAPIDDVARYYAARALFYDETAGYTDPEAEKLRAPIRARYQELFAGHAVLEIACGTGYWTEAIAETAGSVLAVDINPSVILQAKDRCTHRRNVAFRIASAFTLDGVPGGFSAAFGIWWWSHVPRQRIPAFLSTLHSRLASGALVLFVDQLPYDARTRRTDSLGNTLEQRVLPDGRAFEVVKNFPSEGEIRSALAGIADDVQYVVRLDEKSWSVTYRTKP
jgi:SAM-dependent methyltransferase